MDTTNNQQLVHIAKLIAVPLPFALAGFSFGFSYITVPFFYDLNASISTSLVVQIVKLGGFFVAPGSFSASLAASYLAYMLPAYRNTWTFAAVSAVTPIIFTLTFMLPNSINRITEIAGSSAAVQEKATVSLEARQLLSKWVWGNSVRATLWLAAGIAGINATLNA